MKALLVLVVVLVASSLGCVASAHVQDVCLDYVDAQEAMFARCGTEASLGGYCSNVLFCTSLDTIYQECIPTLETMACDDAAASALRHRCDAMFRF